MICFIVGCSNRGKNALTEEFRFDDSGRLAVAITPDGEKTEYTYDERGQLIKVEYPDGPVRYGYDENGNRTWMSDKTGTTEYYYDALDRTMGVLWNHGPQKLILYDHNPWNYLTSVEIYDVSLARRDPTCGELFVRLEAESPLKTRKWRERELVVQQLRKQLKAAKGEGNRGLPEYNVKYSYDLFGNLTEVRSPHGSLKYSYMRDKGQVVRKMPNGITTTFMYSPDGFLTSLRHSRQADELIAEYRYAYNAAGKVVRVEEETASGVQVTQYLWDTRGYLQELQSSDGKRTRYEYDAMGNRKTMSDGRGETQYAYGGFGMLVRAGDLQYEWDKNGSMITQVRGSEKTKIEYDGKGFLKLVITPAANVRMTWDGDGNMVSKKVKGDATYYLSDLFVPLGTVLEELDEFGKLKNSYLFGDVLLGQQDSTGELKYFLEDGFNSIRYVAGRDGAIVGQREYTPFGQPIRMEGELAGNFRMEGERFTPEIGYYIIGGRLYDPMTARFLTPTSSGISSDRFESFNRYAHACSGSTIFHQPRCNQTHKNYGSQYKEMAGQFHVWDAPTPSPNGLNAIFPMSMWQHTSFDFEWHEPRRLPLFWGPRWPSLAPQLGEGKLPVSIKPAIFEGINALILKPFKVNTQQQWNEFNQQLAVNKALQEYADDVAGKLLGRGMVPKIVVPVAVCLSFDGRVTVSPYDRSGSIRMPDSKIMSGDLYVGYASKDEHDKEKRIPEFRNGSRPEVKNKERRDDLQPTKGPDWPDGGGGGGLGGPRGPRGGGFVDPLRSIVATLGGIELGASAEFVGDLGNITGAVFDREKECLVLVGEKNVSVPSLRAQDLAVALVSVFGSPSFDPQFSLDPADPKNPRGDWLKAVYISKDVIQGTDFGDAMFEADWLLKQYAFGVRLDENKRLRERTSAVPGFKSTADITFEQSDRVQDKESWNRFWIIPDEMKLKESDGSIIFDVATMRVKSRKQVVDASSQTGLKDVDDESDPVATAFADLFTDKYDRIASESPEFERLKQLAKAIAFAKWLKKEAIPFDLKWAETRATQKSNSFISKVPALSFEHKKETREPLREKGYTGTRTTTRRVHLFGGVHLNVVPIYAPGDRKVKMLRDVVLAHLSTGDIGPVFHVEHDGKSLGAVVLPITKRGQEIWAGAKSVERDGTVHQFNDQKEITKSTSDDGTVAVYTYDSSHVLRTVDISTKDGWHTSCSRGEDGSIWTSTSPRGNMFECRYGKSGHLSEVRLDGHTWATSRYDAGRREVVVDYGDYSERAIYDADGNVREYATSTNGGTNSSVESQKVTFDYNTSGNVTRLTDESGQFVSISYARDGISPSTIKTPRIEMDYTYDERGRLVDVKQSNGFVASITYCGNNIRDVQIRLPGNQAPHLHGHYANGDDAGREVSSSSGEDRAEYVFGQDGIVHSRDFIGGVARYSYTDHKLSAVRLGESDEATYAYDEKGRLRELRFPDGSRTEYQFADRSSGGKGSVKTTTDRIAVVRYSAPAKPVRAGD